MAETFPDVMTIEEISRYLRVPVSSLYRLAQADKIPCRKVGRHWRFHRETILRWIANWAASDGTLSGRAAEQADARVAPCS